MPMTPQEQAADCRELAAAARRLADQRPDLADYATVNAAEWERLADRAEGEVSR